MQRIAKARPVTLRHTFGDGGVDLTGMALAVTITRADGTTIDPAPNVTLVTGTTDTVEASLTAAQVADLDQLEVAWSADGDWVETDHVSVVGRRFFTIAQLRAESDRFTEANYPDATLEKARGWIETLAERHIGVAFVPTLAVETVTTVVGEPVALSRWPVTALTSATVDGSAKDTSSWTVRRYGFVEDHQLAGDTDVAVIYEHGFDQPPPDLLDACLQAAAGRAKELSNRTIPERASVLTTDVGTFSLALASEDRPTGYPAVDAVLNGYRRRYEARL